MSYYEHEEEYSAKGIDYDLAACLEYNPQVGWSIDDIKEVLAVYEGERDGECWRWAIKLNDGMFVLLVGGCDYTGWDCQSHADGYFANSAYGAAIAEPRPLSGREVKTWHWQAARYELISQLGRRKKETWREKTDTVFETAKKVLLSLSSEPMSDLSLIPPSKSTESDSSGETS